MMIERGTLYFYDVFGFKKIVARSIEHGTKPDGQYADAVFVKFVPKGKRLTRILTEGYRPRILILSGWNHPDPPPIYQTSSFRSYSIMTTKVSCSPEIDQEFDALMESYLLNNNEDLIADYRGYRPKLKSEMIFFKSRRDRGISEIISNLIEGQLKKVQD